MIARCSTGRGGRPDRAASPRAYTLVEVLVVVVVLGIAAALVVPSIGSAGVLRVQAAVRTVVSDIAFAQADALAYQQRRAILFYPDSNAYMLAEVQVTMIGEGQTEVTYEPLLLRGGPDDRYIINFNDSRFSGAEILSASFDGESILIFDELGGPVADPAGDEAGSGGSVVIRGSGSVFRVNVSPFTGQVSVEKIADE